MAFTTQIFTFIFLPVCLLAYYLTVLLQKKGKLSGFFAKIRLMDLALIGMGCVFYLWACFDDVFRLLVYVLVVYLLGRLLEELRGSRLGFVLYKEETEGEKKFVSVALPVLVLGVIFAVCVLIHFKYTGMLAKTWNWLFKENLQGKSLLAPLGISFITFSAISYLADIYKGKAKAGNLIDCALYITFFPKVVSGPIVLWRDFAGQLGDRKISFPQVTEGISRVMIGFAKKLILADTFGACIASVEKYADVPMAWGVALLYMLQIYYDFSGYSDIAIGLSNMLGFEVKENFNFPYLSCSITEFWRRWHISLGTWFREYVYFPLGGGRKGKARTVINIAVVFLLTGFWHGAGWTYMLWGGINGLCNIAEKLLGEKKIYQKTPKGIKWFFTMVVTFFCWELFRFDNFTACKDWFRTMFGMKPAGFQPYNWQHYFDTRMIVLMVIAILGATVWGLPKVQEAYGKFTKTAGGYVVRQVVFVLLFVVAILFMVNSKYSPFIYFQY